MSENQPDYRLKIKYNGYTAFFILSENSSIASYANCSNCFLVNRIYYLLQTILLNIVTDKAILAFDTCGIKQEIIDIKG